MSRSKHQHHKMGRNCKCPSYYYILTNQSGKMCVIKRHRKHVPYGSKGWCGYGGEVYQKHIGWYMTDIVCKKTERQKSKKDIQCFLLDDWYAQH